jgi:uncharacterized protein YlxW (UPF0749 family)
MNSGPAGRDPKRERLKYAFALVVPAMLFGFLVTAQWQGQQERSQIAVRYNAPLTDAAFALQKEQNDLKAQLQALRVQLDQIQANAATQGGATSELQTRIAELRGQAGLAPMNGDGVVVQLDDSHTVVAGGANLDQAICHSTDLTDILNTAWRGGAQAIAVNAQRVVGTTSVYCVGSTIMVNGTLMSPPFNIVVIGPQNAVLGAFDDPSQLKDIKARRDVQGLGFRVTRASAVNVPAYDGALTIRVAVPQ